MTRQAFTSTSFIFSLIAMIILFPNVGQGRIHHVARCRKTIQGITGSSKLPTRTLTTIIIIIIMILTCRKFSIFSDIIQLTQFPFSVYITKRTRFPVNMPDMIRKRFGYGRLWSLRPPCSQNRAGSYRPDPTSRIRLGCVFSIESPGHIVQN